MARLFWTFVGLLLAFVALSPIFYDAYYHNALVKQGNVSMIKNAEKYEYPEGFALLTWQGMGVSLGSVGLLIMVGWLFSRKTKGFSFRIWLVIIVFISVFANEAPIAKHRKHKADYVYLDSNKIEYKYAKTNVTIQLKNIRAVKRRGRAFLIFFDEREVVKIPGSMLSRLNDKKRLRGRFENMVMEYEKKD